MLSITKNFHDARKSRQSPLEIFILSTVYGQYAWSKVSPTNEMLGLTGVALADSSSLADGSITGGSGSLSFLAIEQRINSLGALRESLEPNQGELLDGLSQDESGSVSIEINNVDGALSRLEAQNVLLKALGEIRIGWPSCGAPDFISCFRGRVTSYKGSNKSFTLDLAAV